MALSRPSTLTRQRPDRRIKFRALVLLGRIRWLRVALLWSCWTFLNRDILTTGGLQQQTARAGDDRVNNVAEPQATELQGCWRQCTHHENRIVLDPNILVGGLGDRMAMFRSLMNLAGYLCATLYVPSPESLLETYHARDTPSSKDMQWSDLLQFRLAPSNSTDYFVQYDEQNDTSMVQQQDGWLLVGDKSPKRAPAVIRDFQTVEKESFKEIGRFLWNIRVGYFSWDAQMAKLMHSRNNTTVALPTIRGKYDGCTYTSVDAPHHMRAIVDRVWGRIQTMTSSEIIGYLHVRRGDVTKKCDTSIAKMKRFLNCSFQGMQHNTSVLLFSSDERSKTYRRQMQVEVEKYAQFFDLDALVHQAVQEDIQNGAPAFRDNNYYIFQTLRWIAHRTSYQVLQRLKSYCEDCVNISKKPQWPTRFQFV